MSRIKKIVIRDVPDVSRRILHLAHHESSGQGQSGPTNASRALAEALESALDEGGASGEGRDPSLKEAVAELVKLFKAEPDDTTRAKSKDADHHDGEEPAICVVGNQPIYIIGGKALSHHAAESHAVTDLSFSQQDLLVYESAHPFAVDVQAVDENNRAPRNPFYRDDLRFVSQYDATGCVYRVVAGCIRSTAVGFRYKATIYLNHARIVDPDFTCSP